MTLDAADDLLYTAEHPQILQPLLKQEALGLYGGTDFGPVHNALPKDPDVFRAEVFIANAEPLQWRLGAAMKFTKVNKPLRAHTRLKSSAARSMGPWHAMKTSQGLHVINVTGGPRAYMAQTGLKPTLLINQSMH